MIRWVSHFTNYDHLQWWLILAGLAVFAAGMAVNVWSDLVLVGLFEWAANLYQVRVSALEIWFSVTPHETFVI
ncbi:hypothetical protein QJS10_CPB15g01476 [Acorus calamus]|uniref:Uncharacterized protein n=1 Tax=Acorus calamus TaxID=4465 RepID=A0AAV9D5J5_ACOCL|nr:hypothetical protein QJS10_CPB15g01476 [Acorus calamus]